MNCPCGSPEIVYTQQYLPIEPTPRWAWYDGFSEYVCRCGNRIGRWSGKVPAEGEYEPRYGVEPKEEANR